MEKKEITPNGEKNIGVSVANSLLNQQLTKIQGRLTSQVRQRSEEKDPYYYAFLRLDQSKHSLAECQQTKCQGCEIPVVFRSKGAFGEWLEPIIKKGEPITLEGQWAKSDHSSRPSFTAYSYQILQEPKPLETSDLITLTSGLLTTSLEKKREWVNRTDFLFKKLEELKEISTLSKLGTNFLSAYLTLKQAHYANYQTKHLKSDFDLTHYLSNLSTEIQLVKAHIEAYQSKQTNHEK